MPNINTVDSNWESFWKKDPTGFNETMEQSTLFFAETLAQFFPIKATDHFLDIGCGPGYLVDYLKGKCALIHGTDISEKYINCCKQKYAEYSEISFSTSAAYANETYQDLIKVYQINRVVLLSVLQYYKDINEVKDLIISLQKVAQEQKFTCLLADIIPAKHSTLGDIIQIIKHSIKKGYTLKFMKFLVYAVFSDYRKIKKNGLLQIDESFFINLSKELNVKLKIVKDLTLHTGRYSVLIDF